MAADLVVLCIVAFVAAFIDAVSGGGGLIQTPAALVLLPQYTVVNVIGTLKIPAFTGTGLAVIQYAKKVTMQWKKFSLVALTAFFSAMAGSWVLMKMHNNFMKPVLLVVSASVAIYTYTKKDFGAYTVRAHTPGEQLAYGCSIGLILGFYDGFIGPGAGSFLIMAFISILGFDFLKASAHAKLVNLATNLGSIIYFATHGLIMYEIAFPMAICSGLGGIAGARFAILKGNQFIRLFFLLVVSATILRFAYDILKNFF